MVFSCYLLPVLVLVCWFGLVGLGWVGLVVLKSEPNPPGVEAGQVQYYQRSLSVEEALRGHVPFLRPGVG